MQEAKERPESGENQAESKEDEAAESEKKKKPKTKQPRKREHGVSTILFLPLIFCCKIAALYYDIIRNTPSGVMHVQKGHRLHDRKIFLQEQHALIINNPKIGKLSYSRRMVFSFKERRLTRVEAG